VRQSQLNRVQQHTCLYQGWVGAQEVGASELNKTEVIRVDAPKCKTTTKQSWCSGCWSLTKVQVGAWQLFTIRFILILYLFLCTVLSFNKSIKFSG